MKDSEKKSWEFWEATWKKALKKGRCPIAGCPIRTSTCQHLDKYLGWNVYRVHDRHKVELLYTDDIDLMQSEPPGGLSVEGAWELYKKLKKSGLKRDQISLIIDKVLLGKSFRDIVRERGWTTASLAHYRFKKAIELLRKRGISLGEKHGEK